MEGVQEKSRVKRCRCSKSYNIILMLLCKELKDCFFLLFTILIMVLTKLKETAIENIFFQG